jgi:hypothetical protein
MMTEKVSIFLVVDIWISQTNGYSFLITIWRRSRQVANLAENLQRNALRAARNRPYSVNDPVDAFFTHPGQIRDRDFLPKRSAKLSGSQAARKADFALYILIEWGVR